MQTSFAVKQANEKIVETLNNLDQLYQDLDDNVDKLILTGKQDEALSEYYPEGIDYKLLIDLFLCLTDEELALETTSLIRLIDSIPECQNVGLVHRGFDKYLELKVNKGTDRHSALQLFKTLYSLPLCYQPENRESLKTYLKRFRYQPDFFKAISQFVPREAVKSITEDLTFNFIEYSRRVYHFYYEFYQRGESVDPEMLQSLASLRHYEKIQSILVRLHSDISKVTYSLTVNFAEPTEHIIERLDDFRNNLALVIMEGYEEKKRYSEPPYHILNDYIRDKAGKIVNHENLSKLFGMWQRVLDVYDMRKAGKSYGQINQRLAIKDSSKDAKKAEELILSATQGKFPD